MDITIRVQAVMEAEYTVDVPDDIPEEDRRAYAEDMILDTTYAETYTNETCGFANDEYAIDDWWVNDVDISRD